MECWDRCGPAVLFYQTDRLIFWTPEIVTRKKRRRRKTSMDEFYFNDISESQVNDDLITIILKPMRG